MYKIEPTVVEDSVSIHSQNEIRNRFLGENSAPWFFTYESTQLGDTIDSHSVLYHMLYYYKSGGKHSELFELAKPIMWEIISKAGLPFNEFLQVRAVSQFPIITKRTHNFIHTDLDLDGEYFTGVYYLNDENVDGDTVIFNETDREIHKSQVAKHYTNFTEKMRVTPKQGKAVIFNGHQYHASTLPTKSVRGVLNFSWR
jgi:hypothetical protein